MNTTTNRRARLMAGRVSLAALCAFLIVTVLTATPAWAEDWQETVVTSGHIGPDVPMAIDADGYQHYVYYDSSQSRDKLKWRFESPSGWSLVTVPSTLHAEKVRFILGDDGTPYIAYLTPAGLRLNLRIGSYWRKEIPLLIQTIDHDIALDAQQGLHLTYVDTDWVLWYRYRDPNGYWYSPEMIDDDLGQSMTSIAIDGSGNPNICFYHFQSSSYPVSKGLRVATRSQSGNWSFSTIHEDARGGEIAISSNGVAHAIYYYDDEKHHSYRSSSTGNWSTPKRITFGGLCYALAVDSTGAEHFTYFDDDIYRQSRQSLMHAERDGYSWSFSEVREFNDLHGCPVRVSLAVEREGRPHMAYVENGQLRHISTCVSPAKPQSLALVEDCGKIRLSWPTVPGATSYIVKRDNSEMDEISETYWEDHSPGSSSRTYKVYAKNDCGTSNPVSETGKAKSRPATPANLTTLADCSQITLRWNTVSNMDMYVIVRDGIRIDSVTTTIWTDSDPGTQTRAYKVLAKNGCGDSYPASSNAQVNLKPSDVGTVSLNFTCQAITLDWNAATGATSYVITRDGVRVDSLTGTAWTDNAPGTGTRDYAVIAKNECGEANGSGASGATSEVPGVPANLAVDAACSSIAMTWDAAVGATSYVIVRNSSRIDSVSETSWSDNDPGSSTRRYTIIAKNDCGETAGSTASATAGQAPDAPTNLVLDTGCNSIALSWTAASGASSYVIVRNGARVDSLTSTSWTDNIPGTDSRSYTVIAKNSCGETAGSAASATAGQAPAAPANLDLSTACGSIALTWTTASGATSYVIVRNGARVDSLTSTAWTDNNPGTDSRSYTVIAKNSCGETAGSAASATAGQAPAAPADFALDAGCNSIALTWSATSGATSYVIVRNGARVDSLTSTAWTDNNPGTDSRGYTIIAKNSCGETAGSAASATAGQAPAAPANFELDAGCNSIALTWSATSGATSYVIVRNGARVDSLTSTAWTDNNPGTDSRSFTVIAKNSCGETAGSTASATAGQAPAAPADLVLDASCNSIALTWTDAAGATSYIIVRDGARTDSLTGTAWTDNNPGTDSRSYTVIAKNSCGETAGSTASATAGQAPAAPADLVLDASCNSIALTWTDAAGATSYVIVRDGARTDSLTGTSWTDNNPGTDSRSYTIIAKNSCGETAGSAASATAGQAPAAPADLVLDASCNSIALTWTDAAGATSYVIVRDGARTDSLTGTSWTDNNPGTDSRGYTIIAKNSCGETAGSAASATAGQAPAAPANFELDAGCNSIALTWTATSGATSYIIVRDGTRTDSLTGTSWTDNNPGTDSRSYTVIAKNSCGETAGSTASATAGQAPAAPADLVLDASCNSIALTWTDAAGATSYVIVRDGARTDSLTGTSWTDNNPGTDSRSYTVIAKNSCGETAGSAASATAGQAPAAPANLDLSTACGSIALTWTTASVATSYVIVRNGARVDSLTSTAWTDNNPGTDSRSYTVIAKNSCGETAGSAASATAGQAPAAPANFELDAGCNSIALTWSATSGATSYIIVRDGARTDSLTGTSWTDNNPGTDSRSYTIIAKNSCGETAGSAASATAGQAPAAPANFELDAGCNSTALTWSATSGATSYVIVRNGARVDSLTSTAWTDNNPGTDSRSYTVIAKNSCGETAGSAASATAGQAPAAPANFELDAGCNSIALTWSATSGATSYIIVRDGARTDSLTGTSWTDNNPGTDSRSYTVIAKNSCGELAGQPGVAQSICIDSLTINLAASYPLSIRTGESLELPTPVVNGGIPPYAFTAIGLPGGFHIDSTAGAIAGTAGRIGSFDFTINVTDSDGNTARLSCLLDILPTPTAIIYPDTLRIRSAGGNELGSALSPITIASSDGSPIEWAITGGDDLLVFSGNEGVAAGSEPTMVEVHRTASPLPCGNYSRKIQVDCGDTTKTIEVIIEHFPTKVGDIDCDQFATAKDLAAMTNHVLRVEPLPFAERHADFNNDGKVNVGDMSKTAWAIVADMGSEAHAAKSAKSGIRVELEVDHDEKEMRVALSGSGSFRAGSILLDWNGPSNVAGVTVQEADPRLSIVSADKNGHLGIVFYTLENNPIRLDGNRIELALIRWEDGEIAPSLLRGETAIDGYEVNQLVAGSMNTAQATEVSLGRIYPNPIRTNSTIEFTLPRAADVNIAIYSVAGRLVREVKNGQTSAGSHTVRWDRRDDSGREVSNGVYFLRFESEGNLATKKLNVIR